MTVILITAVPYASALYSTQKQSLTQVLFLQDQHFHRHSETGKKIICLNVYEPHHLFSFGQCASEEWHGLMDNLVQNSAKVGWICESTIAVNYQFKNVYSVVKVRKDTACLVFLSPIGVSTFGFQR